MVSEAIGDVSDPGLSGQGVLRIEWAAREMSVLNMINLEKNRSRYCNL